MHYGIFVFISVLLFFTFYWVIKNCIFVGKWEYIIYFLLVYFPIYTVYLSVAYLTTESIILVKSLQLFKDLIVIIAILTFLLYQKNIVDLPLRLTIVDKLFVGFLLLATFFLFVPIGEATFTSKLLYFKGLLIPALIYFMGRNTSFNEREVGLFFKTIFLITVTAFGMNLIEFGLNTHLQTFTGYAVFNSVFNNIEPVGNFGLSWTFETQTTSKRFASFFSDPLDLASSVLLGFAAGLIWFLTSKKEVSFPYILVMFCSMGSLFFASSRAAFAAFFIMIFFIAVIFKLNKLILFGIGLAVSFVVFVIFFASEDFYFFVVDTLTFENPSSFGHLLVWIEAIESMINNPFGIGLAMSGNSGSVTDDVRVGGENQFLIYGVQLGFLGMIIYILLLGYSISRSIYVFRSTDNLMSARIAFTAAGAKTGFLLPLFTANAEMYIYTSWITWWMVGYSMNEYSKIRSQNV